MTPSKILPANEAVLRRRFPDALMKIMEMAMNAGQFHL